MQAWGITDPGLVRSQNQDTYAIEYLDDGMVLAVVCDGMGGAKAGNVASRLALDVFVNTVRCSADARMSVRELRRVLEDAVKLCNTAVYEQAELSPDYEGMGTTIVAALVRPHFSLLANVGDSRAYLVNEAGIEQITVDHSLVEMMVRRGEITREEARSHPVRNLITRAVGTGERVEVDFFEKKLQPGEALLLCSDGLSNLVADQEMLFEVKHGGSREDCCERLLKIALEREAPDNVTAVLVSV